VSESDSGPRRRGRPRKILPHLSSRLPLSVTLGEWCERTGITKPVARRQIEQGILKHIQRGPNAEIRIPTSEFKRHGYIESLDELREIESLESW
jgi:hypothetical protein